MTWDVDTIDHGDIRDATLYGKMTARAAHLLSNYTPIVGGTSPLSRMTTNADAYALVANVLITPCTCAFYAFIAYKVTAGGTGAIRITHNGSNYDSTGLTSTSVTGVTVTGLTGTGSPAKVTISALCEPGEITVYSVSFIALANPTGMITTPPTLAPEPVALASGLPISTDFIRRLNANAGQIMKSRRTALAYFAHHDIRSAGVHTLTFKHTYQLSVSSEFWLKPASFKFAMLAPVDSWMSLSSDFSADSETSSNATTIYESSPVYQGNHLQLSFEGPVESFVVYENVS